ncbi:hypothetical protein ACIGW0_04630 [Streptomyces bikiniensis]|uniref:Uncharacterized protein n=1 Tax=Streptomyces bikiniensis TaxID=1896 RepID=A0ABW8CP79_STRBI
MTENRPTITVEQFAELSRVLACVNETSLSEYLANKGKGWDDTRKPVKEHREWALYVLSELGLSIETGGDVGKFLNALGIQSHTFGA